MAQSATDHEALVKTADAWRADRDALIAAKSRLAQLESHAPPAAEESTHEERGKEKKLKRELTLARRAVEHGCVARGRAQHSGKNRCVGSPRSGEASRAARRRPG